ncbi:MAG: hypothetical protein ACFKPT_00720 [Gloeotrichia echinulata GP01]
MSYSTDNHTPKIGNIYTICLTIENKLIFTRPTLRAHMSSVMLVKGQGSRVKGQGSRVKGQILWTLDS